MHSQRLRTRLRVVIAPLSPIKVGKIALEMVEMPKTGVLYDSGLGSDDARRPVWYYCIDRSESGVDPRGQIFPRLDPRG